MYINYDKSVVTIPNSILKHFGFEPIHKTNPIIDSELASRDYQNVIVMLFDGMGSYNLDVALDKNAFLQKQKLTDLTSTFPATTTASTTSIKTGLYPGEHLYLAWNMYFEDLDDNIDIFPNTSKKGIKYQDTIINRYTNPKFITETINEKYYSKEISNYGGIKFNNLAELKDILKAETEKKGKKYFYVYHTEPDSTMHANGAESKEAITKIKEINSFLESLELKDTIIFVIADHGHISHEAHLLSEYPLLEEILRTPITLEDRSVGLNIKEGMDDKLLLAYNTYFKDDYILKSKEQMLEENFYGPCVRDDIRKFMPDYTLLSISKKSITDNIDKYKNMKGHHAGLTDEEGYIPLIVLKYE